MQIDCSALIGCIHLGPQLSAKAKEERQFIEMGYPQDAFGPVVALCQTGDYHTQRPHNTVTHNPTGSYNKLACQGLAHAMLETDCI